MNTLIAGVAVENTVYHFDKIFDYVIPAEFIDYALVGSRVCVPFGRGNNKRQAMVMYVKPVDDSTDITKLKEVS